MTRIIVFGQPLLKQQNSSSLKRGSFHSLMIIFFSEKSKRTSVNSLIFHPCCRSLHLCSDWELRCKVVYRCSKDLRKLKSDWTAIRNLRKLKSRDYRHYKTYRWDSAIKRAIMTTNTMVGGRYLVALWFE